MMRRGGSGVGGIEGKGEGERGRKKGGSEAGEVGRGRGGGGSGRGGKREEVEKGDQGKGEK